MSDYEYCCCRYQHGDRCCRNCRKNEHHECTDRGALQIRAAAQRIRESKRGGK